MNFFHMQIFKSKNVCYLLLKYSDFALQLINDPPGFLYALNVVSHVMVSTAACPPTASAQTSQFGQTSKDIAHRF